MGIFGGTQHQIGGLYIGAGAALSEDMIYDEDGKLLNPNFMDHKLFGMRDRSLPKIDFVETEEPGGVFRVKGIGEGTAYVAPAAISGAIYNAAGVHVDPPITPEKVLRALKDTKG